MFFLRHRLNDLLCLENSFGNSGWVRPAFNDEKSQKQIGGHAVSECKEDEFIKVWVLAILDLCKRF